MRQYDLVSRIFLVLSIIKFALAAPVLVHDHEDAITVLGMRGGEKELFDLWPKIMEDYIPKAESSGSVPFNPVHEETNVMDRPPPGPSTSTESDREPMGVHAPSSSPVLENWFNPHDGSMGAHAPGRDPGPSTVLGSNDKLVVSEPLSPTRGSPTGFGLDHEYEVVPPPSSGQLSQTELNVDHEYEMVHPPPTVPEHAPRSMSGESQLKNIQTVGDVEKGKAKDSRFSGTSRDVVNAAQRELQPERSLDPEN